MLFNNFVDEQEKIDNKIDPKTMSTQFGAKMNNWPPEEFIKKVGI